MQKYEVNRDGVKSYNILEQDITHDIANFMPELLDASKDQIRIFFLDKDSYFQAKELGESEDNYPKHLENGNIEIRETEGDALLLTVTAVEKSWADLYGVDDEGKEVYQIKSEE